MEEQGPSAHTKLPKTVAVWGTRHHGWQTAKRASSKMHPNGTA